MPKKTFKGNPAMQFINAETKQPTASEPEAKDIYYIPVERKSRHVQLLFRPSLYRKIAARAEQQGISVNEYIHRAMDQHEKETSDE